MNNQRGALQRPSEKKLESANIKVVNKAPTLAVGMLTILLIITYIFTLKIYEPVNNIMITGGVLVYPLTFLILAYVFKYYGFKQTRKCIFQSAMLFVIFILLMMICVVPRSNNETSQYNAVIQYLFTNNFFVLGKLKIFYPTLGQFFSVVISFIISHLLFATIYNAIHNYTVDYLAVGLSVFIAAITDRILFMPILFLENLIKGSNTFDYFIKCLTSEFMAAIVSTILIIILYVIITSVKDALKKEKY